MVSDPGTRTASDDVVVGYDGSGNAALAVDWAADEAGRRGVGLHVVSAAHYAGMPYPVGLTPPVVPRSLEVLSDDLARKGRERAARRLPEERIEAHVVVGGPAAALVDASENAGLVVVGHRGHGAFASAMLGSVSIAVAEHAACPVVVVRGAMDPESQATRPITVGVDGTPSSDPALLFAAEQADRWGVPLRIVCAWMVMARSGWEFATWRADDDEVVADELAESARKSAVEAVERVRANWPDLVVDSSTPEVSAALGLEEASRRSGLLVVGSRGAGAIGRLFLGSVSHAVLHHSACPVAVVRP